MTDAEFEAAFDQHKDAVYRFAWRMLPSAAAAEDVVQDTFLALLRHRERFDPARGPLRAFLLGIARNLACKRWRDERRWDELLDEPSVALVPDVERADLGDSVGRAVRALPPLQREVVILAEYEELSLAEIARAVSADVGAVKSRLHRGRENLRKTLAPLRMNAHGTIARP